MRNNSMPHSMVNPSTDDMLKRTHSRYTLVVLASKRARQLLTGEPCRIANPTEKENEKFITDSQRLEEEIFLGFRKMSGVNVQNINSKYDIDFEEKYNDILKKYEGLNLLEKTNNGYKLTPNGVLVSNTILAEFLEG